HRHFDAIAPVHPCVVQTAHVAHPVTVHRLVRPRLEAHHLIVAHLQGDIAPLRAPRADGRRAVEIPRTRLVKEILRDQRPDWADLDHVVRPDIAFHTLVEEGVDGVPVASLYHPEPLILRHLAHEADAPRAH